MCMRSSWIRCAVPLGLAAALTLAPARLRAGTEADKPAVSDEASETTETPSSGGTEPFPARAAVRALIEKETAKTKLPADVAEAVVFVESHYDSGVIGLM